MTRRTEGNRILISDGASRMMVNDDLYIDEAWDHHEVQLKTKSEM